MRRPPPNFEVPYSASRFPSGLVIPNGKLVFSNDDLAHALFTTGRAPGDQKRYGRASTWEWLHRTAIIPAYIRRIPYGGLSRSRIVQELDRSELVGISYALGMAMTTIFCRTKLSVTHLLHIDRYSSQYAVSFGGTRKRADLIGYSPRGWIVAEAKGRSRSMEPTLRKKLMDQKSSVSSIAGSPPSIALGCVSSFPLGGSMRVDAFDPDQPSEEAVRYDQIDLDRYLYTYYNAFLNALGLGERIDNGQFVMTDFGVFGVRIGLLSTIVDLTRRASAGSGLKGFSEDVQDRLLSAIDIAPVMFSDGSFVETRWADAVQVSDWQL